ncbi:MAG TPA: hypothetical protein V6D05_00075 [Stenomitos sp.]
MQDLEAIAQAAWRSLPATRLEAYLELARKARDLHDPFSAETIYRRAILEARTVREAVRVAEVVFLSWGAEDDRYFRPMKRQLIEHALSTAIELSDSIAELSWIGEKAEWMVAREAQGEIARRLEHLPA